MRCGRNVWYIMQGQSLRFYCVIIRSADYRFTMRTPVLHDLQIRDMCTSDNTDSSTDYNLQISMIQ